MKSLLLNHLEELADLDVQAHHVDSFDIEALVLCLEHIDAKK